MQELEELVLKDKNYLNDLEFTRGAKILNLDNMSSGEKLLIIRLLSILTSITNNSLVIIEDPELHLNPSWIKQVISMLQLLFSEYNAHFIIATHSYAFINSLFPENILLVGENGIDHPNFNTFLANESEINSKMFNNLKTFNYPEEKIINMIKLSNQEELEKLFKIIGESYLKFIIYKKMESDISGKGAK